MENCQDGISVGGKMLQSLHFADDRGMVADTKTGLQRIMDRLSATAEEYGMKINTKKTKVMTICKGEPLVIKVNGCPLEQVKEFRYLGSLITEDNRCHTELSSQGQE